MKNIIIEELKELLRENGLVSDIDFLRNIRNRIQLNKEHPGSFMCVNKKGVPVFPLLTQYGGISDVVLIRSIAAAKTMIKKTGDPKYIEILAKLMRYKKEYDNKTIKHPKLYVNKELESVFNNVKKYNEYLNNDKNYKYR